jgi:ankyrin repeat protein
MRGRRNIILTLRKPIFGLILALPLLLEASLGDAGNVGKWVDDYYKSPPSELCRPYRIEGMGAQAARQALEAKGISFSPGPFCQAVYFGDKETICLFIEAGMNVSRPDSAGNTPLIIAAQLNQVDVAYYLIEKGVNINYQNDYKFQKDYFGLKVQGATALMYAAWAGHRDMVELLLRNGADPLLKNIEGKTSLDLAMFRGHYSVAYLIEEFLRMYAQ